MKVTVRIHTGHGLEFRTKKVGSNNRILLRKKPKWEPELKGFEVKHLRFGRAKYYTDITEEAPATWSYEDLKPKEIPQLTKAEVLQFAKAKIWVRRFKEGDKQPGQWLLYAILLVSIGGLIFNFLISTGRLRL